MNGLVNLLGARALPDAVPVPAVRDDVPDAIGGGATRNAVAMYDLPHQHIVHHVLDDVPAFTGTSRVAVAPSAVSSVATGWPSRETR